MNLINTTLEQLNSEIDFNNRLIERLKAASIPDIKQRILEIKQLLPSIDKKINALELVISEDTANLRLLETDIELLKERAAIPPTLSQVIYSYKNSILDFESEKFRLESELMILETSVSNYEITADNMIENINGLNNNISSIILFDKNLFTDISAEIFKLSQERNTQERNLKLLTAQTPSNSILIGEISSEKNNPKTLLFALIGFIFGTILSIILVLIIGIFKAHKEEKAI